MNTEQSNIIYNLYIYIQYFYSKKKKTKKKKQLKIIANKFNNHSSIQQLKHYKLQNKTTKKYTPKIS